MLVGVRECRPLAVLSASLLSDTQQRPVSLRNGRGKETVPDVRVIVSTK